MKQNHGITEMPFATAMSITAHEEAQGWTWSKEQQKYMEGTEKDSLEKLVRQKMLIAEEQSIDYVFFEAEVRVIAQAIKMEKSVKAVRVGGRAASWLTPHPDGVPLCLELR